MVFGVACLPGCAPEDAPETGTTAGTEPVPEEANDFIYATGFEETDSEKFTVGDFGLDPNAATASTKYADWSLVAPYDGEILIPEARVECSPKPSSACSLPFGQEHGSVRRALHTQCFCLGVG